MIKAVIFDLDGTLADTLGGITHYVNRTMAAFGLPSLSQQQIKYFVGNGAKVLIDRALCHLGASHLSQQAFSLYNQLYDAHPHYALRAYEGIGQMLDDLKAAGIRTAVFSNKPHSTAAPVCQRLFPNQLDVVLGNKEGLPHKPDITGARQIWEQLGVTAEQCMYVGDTDVDMLTGKAGGMLTVGVLWGFRDRQELVDNGADVLVEHPCEITQLALRHPTFDTI